MTTVVIDKLTYGNSVTAAMPRQNVVGSEFCIACGKKMGKVGYYVHLSTAGIILPMNYTGLLSQGAFLVGTDCAKKFDRKVLAKRERGNL